MKKLTQVLLFVASLNGMAQSEFKSLDGHIVFNSSKEMNLLEAFSENMLTKWTPAKKHLLFKVQVTSFNFSNCSRLVEKLFNDVYMESYKYHWSTFEGTIMDSLNLSNTGEYNVNLKGILNIHGVPKQRTIYGKITVRENGIVGFDSEFEVPLADHNIKILPDDVNRLAEVIKVKVSSVVVVRK
ncbi:MAG: YceI family protein [Bacteroidota bacterium]|nr:YceI family protein [Bacteroidota bacterium]